MTLLKILLVFVFAFYNLSVHSLPTTDIGILDLGKLISKANNKTVDFKPLTKRDGYDNQPKFSNDGKVLYFTRGITNESGKSQTDIMAYSFAQESFKNISNSPDSSEYSPTPYQDGLLTIIGVADDNGKQYLNQLSIEAGEQKTFTTAIEPIGYHAWLDDKNAAVFVLGDVMTLQVLPTNANRKPTVLAENIGRSFHRIAENKVSYTVEEEGKHRIYILDGNHDSHDTGIVLPKGVQDYAWLSEKEVIFGEDSKLYLMDAGQKVEIIDLKELGVNSISRLAIDEITNRLALVYSRK
ncbi:PD40 domain-containing protein [Kangiella sp. HZ709]|uniref:PD40 domain-containing protein n=1 Tax=Kangiella sp. HZ709 TaxID=2666328 RepID=UPI0012AEED17|nr:PD40 domain-containing protein [Kangiella sp. HZ709]MRX27120.1 hypothetical protein [Kangiella sp. HZ709]